MGAVAVCLLQKPSHNCPDWDANDSDAHEEEDLGGALRCLHSQGDHDEGEHAEKREAERGAGRTEEPSDDSDGCTHDDHEDGGDCGEDTAGVDAGIHLVESVSRGGTDGQR